MNTSSRRDFFAFALIVLAFCIGAWFLFVQPKARELARLRAQILDLGAQSSQVSEQSVESLARQVAATRDLADFVARENRAADDSSQLYAIIMSLAAQCSVKVHSLDPAAVPAHSADGVVTITPVQVSVVGEYENLARFFDSLVTVHRFIRPGALSIAPYVQDNSPLAAARFTCQALHFKIPDALASTGGSPDAPQ